MLIAVGIDNVLPLVAIFLKSFVVIVPAARAFRTVQSLLSVKLNETPSSSSGAIALVLIE